MGTHNQLHPLLYRHRSHFPCCKLLYQLNAVNANHQVEDQDKYMSCQFICKRDFPFNFSVNAVNLKCSLERTIGADPIKQHHARAALATSSVKAAWNPNTREHTCTVVHTKKTATDAIPTIYRTFSIRSHIFFHVKTSIFNVLPESFHGIRCKTFWKNI